MAGHSRTHKGEKGYPCSKSFTKQMYLTHIGRITAWLDNFPCNKSDKSVM